MVAIEPRSGHSSNKELRSVGARTSIGHRQKTRSSVLLGEVLILKLVAVNGLSTGTVVSGKVASLQHKVGNDSVEGGSGVSKAVLASTEGSEVLGGLGDHILVQLEGDFSKRLAVGRDLEKHVVSCNGGGGELSDVSEHVDDER